MKKIEETKESIEEETEIEQEVSVETPKKRGTVKIWQIVLIALFAVICIGVTIYLYPYIKRMGSDDAYRQAFIDKIQSFGWAGIIVVIFCFVIQNVLAVIPAAPFEIIAGAMYGTWGGILVSLIGCTLGALVCILLVRLFGENFAKKFVNMEDKKKFKFVDDPGRTKVIMFSILFMPGIPKDFLCFLVPFTKVKTYQFLILNVIARAPSVFISTLFGESLLTGNLTLAIVLFAIAAVISILALVFNKKIVEFINKIAKKKIVE